MKKVLLLMAVALLTLPLQAKKKQPKVQTEREYWCEQAWKMAQPVLENILTGAASPPSCPTPTGPPCA